jgi:hypothetical protein
VCYQVPVDACGVPVECATSPATTSATQSQPLPAKPTLAPQKKTSPADEKPQLPPASAMPGPVDAEKSASPAPAGKTNEAKPKEAAPDTAYPTPKAPAK